MATDERLAPENTHAAERASILEDARAELSKLVEIIRARRLGERVEGSVALQAVVRALQAGATASVADMLRDAALDMIRGNGGATRRTKQDATTRELPLK